MADDIAKKDPILQKALEVKDRIAPQFMANPNVTGVGVGYRIVNGQRTREVCIRVYVSKKRPRHELRAEEVLPDSMEGIPVDVIEATFEIQQGEPPVSEHQRRHNPLVGGISIGNFILGGSGTLGVSVFDNVRREDMILSNWHVMCGRFDCAVGEAIIQPGTGGDDTGGAGDVVARLHRFALTDQVDGAIARLTGDRFLLKDVLGLGAVSEVGSPALGMRVRKAGRTTGVTVGTIADESADISVGGYPDGTRTFHNQIVIEDDEVSRRGDSGSVWIDDSNRVIGLHFAGSTDGTRADANPIAAVLAALNINLRIGITMHDFVAITANVLF
jgi:hypothetical protein